MEAEGIPAMVSQEGAGQAYGLAVGRLGGMPSLVWLVLHIALKAASGLLLLASAGCLIFGFDRRGIQLGYVGLLLSLTVVDLMEFYFSQFSAIVPAAIQFGLLLVMLQYRRRYFNHPLFSGFSR